MKKTMWLGVLMLSAAAGFAQESRQDVSFSGTGSFGPTVYGAAAVHQSMTGALGILTSYRYMVTPRSALELNYSFMQDSQKYSVSYDLTGRIHSRMQEATGAYVYSMTFKRYNPFVQAGLGGLIFTPVLDQGTNELGTKGGFNLTGLIGGGMAYELSPSWDIRAEYRGFITKMPYFGVSKFNTNRYEVISQPTIGVAYHF